MEHSPVRSSASNGVIERGIQSVEGQVGVLLDASETTWNLNVPVEHAVMAYLIEYAAFLLNRFEVGHDGVTAFER